MKIDLKKLIKSFYYAFSGFRHAWNKEQNLRIECFITVVIFILGVYFHITIFEWAWISISLTLLLSFELLNTALERLTDLVIERRKTNLAKQSKDIAASAVLITAIQTGIAMLIVFSKYIF